MRCSLRLARLRASQVETNWGFVGDFALFLDIWNSVWFLVEEVEEVDSLAGFAS